MGYEHRAVCDLCGLTVDVSAKGSGGWNRRSDWIDHGAMVACCYECSEKLRIKIRRERLEIEAADLGLQVIPRFPDATGATCK